MVNDLVFYCGQTAGCIKIPVGMDVCLSPGDFVLDGDPVPPQKGGGAPPPQIFGPCLLWPNGGMDQDGTWHGVGLGPVHIVLDGDTALLPQKGTDPQFSTHLYCGQPAVCIKMPLGMEVGLSPGDFVLDLDPAPYPKRGGAPPNFRPTSILQL